MSALIEARKLRKYFPVKQSTLRNRAIRYVHAVEDLDIRVMRGETLGLVGESGCGKTTLGKLLIRLIEPTSGEIFFDGTEILSLGKSDLRMLRKDMQMVFQDPFASLNPRKTVRTILSQPFEVHDAEEDVDNAVPEILESVGLTPPEDFIDRYPHEFSGGQRQRIAFARAIALNPKLVVADEPVSSLDLSVRGQILKLMIDMQRRLDLTYLFITHDLAVVRSISNTVMIMYLGKVVEVGQCAKLFGNPKHPYTRALLSATPIPNPRRTRGRERIVLKGEVPSPINPPRGCSFHPRCKYAVPKCVEEVPILEDVGDGCKVACVRYIAGEIS